ncbi:MAG: hydroxysqualene dehydroxylase HpnE, partial [Phycisphaeraceae bacterium]
DLYRRLGVDDKIQWFGKLYFTAPAAGITINGDDPWVIDELEADDLPAPLHMTRSLLQFKTLSLTEKVAIARGMLGITRLGKTGREALGDQTFLDWLQEHHQPRGAIEKFWSVITISALNELPQTSAASYAMQVFQEGFLANADASVVGLPAVPLVQLYDPADPAITAAGGRVILGAGAQRFIFEQGRVTALELADGTTIGGSVFISAVPFDRLAKLVDPQMCKADARLRRLDRVGVSPIIGIHLWFDRCVMHLPHLILMRSPLQWIFNKSADPEVGGQHLHGVISAAHDLVDTPADDLIKLVVAEVRKALPKASDAELLHAKVVKEKRATFSVRAGIDRLRPAARGAIPNLYLAGDWCDTGWPATMEGAVRSGYLAAAAVLHDAHQPIDGLVPDLPRSSLYRLVSR